RLGLKVLEIPIPIIPRPGRAVQSRFLRQIDQLLKIIAIALKGVKKPGDAKFYFLDCALHSFIPPEKAIMQRD
ncbi:MAG: hypothetical protein QXE21_06150, partial [Candidatus Korarchaeota archaeon]